MSDLIKELYIRSCLVGVLWQRTVKMLRLAQVTDSFMTSSVPVTKSFDTSNFCIASVNAGFSGSPKLRMMFERLKLTIFVRLDSTRST